MKNLFVSLFLTIASFSYGQNFKHLEELQADSLYENVCVKKIDSDSLVSNFVIWIKKDVKAHKHLVHSETIIVLDGTGTMMLGDKKIEIKKGDYIFVPRNTVHSVLVTSKDPLKVISIQAPEFKGDDRIFVESNSSGY